MCFRYRSLLRTFSAVFYWFFASSIETLISPRNALPVPSKSLIPIAKLGTPATTRSRLFAGEIYVKCILTTPLHIAHSLAHCSSSAHCVPPEEKLFSHVRRQVEKRPDSPPVVTEVWVSQRGVFSHATRALIESPSLTSLPQFSFIYIFIRVCAFVVIFRIPKIGM